MSVFKTVLKTVLLSLVLLYGFFHLLGMARIQQVMENFNFGGLLVSFGGIEVPTVMILPEKKLPRQKYTKHIVAVGDLHGDLLNALKVLTFSGVTDSTGKWTGNIDFLVQTGDIIDRGDDTLKLFALMDNLRSEAHAAGGQVVSVLGNHEWMNAIGDWRYVYPTELATFNGGWKGRQKEVCDKEGSLAKTWKRNYTTAARLPLHPILGPPNSPYPPPPASGIDPRISHSALSFVHGGLAPQFSNLSPFPTKINDIASSLLDKLQHRNPQPPPHPPNHYPGLPHTATDEEKELYSEIGPLWYRGWALEPEDSSVNDLEEDAEQFEKKLCKAAQLVLNLTGSRHMIMGHTPNFHNIVSRCDGKVVIIDTGISSAYGGVLSALDVYYTLTPRGDDGWIEREVLTAIYEDRREVLATYENVL